MTVNTVCALGVSIKSYPCCADITGTLIKRENAEFYRERIEALSSHPSVSFKENGTFQVRAYAKDQGQAAKIADSVCNVLKMSPSSNDENTPEPAKDKKPRHTWTPQPSRRGPVPVGRR